MDQAKQTQENRYGVICPCGAVLLPHPDSAPEPFRRCPECGRRVAVVGVPSGLRVPSTLLGCFGTFAALCLLLGATLIGAAVVLAALGHWLVAGLGVWLLWRCRRRLRALWRWATGDEGRLPEDPAR